MPKRITRSHANGYVEDVTVNQVLDFYEPTAREACKIAGKLYEKRIFDEQDVLDVVDAHYLFTVS